MVVEFEKILIGVSCLFFILVFVGVLFCLTDFKLCFHSTPKQKIFHDSVLENKVAMQQDNSHKNSESSIKRDDSPLGKNNRTHPFADNISEDTIDLESVQDNFIKCNGSAVESNTPECPSYHSIDETHIISGLLDGKSSLKTNNTTEPEAPSI